MSRSSVRDKEFQSRKIDQEMSCVVNARQPLMRRTKMFKMKLLLVIAVLVVSGALVALPGAMAASSSFVTSAGNTGCTMTSGSQFVTLTPDDGGGTWPIPFTNSTLGTSFEYRYILTSNVSNAQSNVQVALNARISSPVTSDGTTPISNFQAACAGTLSNNNFALNVCDVRVASLTGTSSGRVSLFMHDISTHGPVGGATVKSGGFVSSCSPLEVPIVAPPAFASVNSVDTVTANGQEFCIPLGPDGCPLNGTTAGTAPYLCSDGTKAPLIQVQLHVVDELGNTHVPTWFQGTTDNPACPRGILALNATSCYLTVGGRTYKIC